MHPQFFSLSLSLSLSLGYIFHMVIAIGSANQLLCTSPLVLGLKGKTSEWLTVMLHNQVPSINDWIGVFSPANFSASTCTPESSMVTPPLLCTAPIKFQYANYSSPNYKDT